MNSYFKTGSRNVTAILFSLLLAACGGGGSPGGPAGATDTTPPTVSSTSPANNASGVAVNASITATFSENMDASTITDITFTLDSGVTGTVAYSGTTATFTPSANLANGMVYTATISSAAKDAAGNAMAANKTWSFTTKPVHALNDTGITASLCLRAGSDIRVACDSADAIALNNAQDGMTGFDADTASNDNADGKLGFSFTAVAGGCVQDNVTGLMWEAKTTDGGLHDLSKSFTNYDSTSLPQKWDGSAWINVTQAEIDAVTNTVGFVAAVNASNLCGYNDWRLPTVDELQGLVDYSVALPGPTIDTTWFPNTLGDVFWSSSPVVANSPSAWLVFFGIGYEQYRYRYTSASVRLVRVGQ